MSLFNQLSDHELSVQLAANEEVFDEIYDRYWPILYRAAFNVLKDEEACLDVVQDVYVWLWEHRTELKANSIKAYLLIAVKYKVANYIRNGKVRESFYERIPKIALDNAFVHEELEVKELREIIQQFVSELPERCQEVFNLSRNEHLTNKQIAEKLGITEKTVENQINKALKRLKQGLGKFSLLFSFL